MKKAQEKLAKCGMLVTKCKGQLRDVVLVQTIEHNIRHAKFGAADTLIRWVGENLARKCLTCDTVISNTLTVTPTYSAFTPELGSRLPGLASEHYATLGTIKGGRVKEKGGCVGGRRTHLRTHW